MRFATLAICGAPLHRLSARGDPHQYADAIALLVLGTAALFTFVLIDALNLAWSAFGWLVGSVSLIVSVKPRLSRWLRDIATREQADIVAALQLPGIESSQLLVICARNDEVRRWLRTWDAAAQAAFVIACGLLWSVAGAAGWNFPVVADGVARSVFHAGFNDVDVFGFDGWTLIVAAITLCAIWAVALLCGGIVRWPAYWREPPLGNAVAEIGTDRVPPAEGDCHAAYTFDVPSATIRRRITGHLRHRALCEEPAVVSGLVYWILHGRSPSSNGRSPEGRSGDLSAKRSRSRLDSPALTDKIPHTSILQIQQEIECLRAAAPRGSSLPSF